MSGYDEVRRYLYSTPATGFQVTPRRRLLSTSGSVSISHGEAQLIVPTSLGNLRRNEALIIDFFSAYFSPSASIEIDSLALSIGTLSPLQEILPLAQPTLTTLTPANPVTLSALPIPLIQFEDIATIALLAGQSYDEGSQTALLLRFGLFNAGINPVDVTAQLITIHRRIFGLQEG